MNWYKRAQVNNIKLGNDCFDSHGGEVFCRIIAKEEITGRAIGYIDYSIYDNEIDIKMIEVSERYRRQGIGTKMIEFLKEENPNVKIHAGLATNLGFPFIQNLKERKIL
jgi:ribosomal protein S18 acetylase RimI-like enzyme